MQDFRWQNIFHHLKIESQQAMQPTVAFVLLGLMNSVFHRSVRCSAFCPGLTITVELQNIFSTLVLRSAAVAGGVE